MAGRARRAAGWVLLAASAALILRATQGGQFSIPPVRIPPAWCLVCGPGWLMDGVSNVVLFLPLGVSLALVRVRVAPAAACAALLSLAVEGLQAAGIPPLRSPSLADLVTNTAGGAAGALLVALGPRLLVPSRSLAMRLLAGWGAGALGTLALTAAALQPLAGTARAAVTVARSPYQHAPGFGWYGGVLEAVTVNGHADPPRGGGPAVLVTSGRPERVAVSATLRGRDARAYQRAMVFLHTPGDTLPYALLSQHGSDLRWELRTRGVAWGLFNPGVRLRSVVPDTPDDAAPLQIQAQGARGTLMLAAQPAGAAPPRPVAARLTPGVGWVLLQSVVKLSDPVAPVVRLAWFLVLAAPLAYWSRLLGTGWMVAVAGSVIATTAAAARLGGLPLPDVGEWGTLGAAFAIGAAAAWGYGAPRGGGSGAASRATAAGRRGPAIIAARAGAPM